MKKWLGVFLPAALLPSCASVPAPAPTVAAGSSSNVVSAFGQAGYEFVIDHR
jgi:hypothetical protein